MEDPPSPDVQCATLKLQTYSQTFPREEDRGPLPSNCLVNRTCTRSQKKRMTMMPSIMPLQQNISTDCHSGWPGCSSSWYGMASTEGGYPERHRDPADLLTPCPSPTQERITILSVDEKRCILVMETPPGLRNSWGSGWVGPRCCFEVASTSCSHTSQTPALATATLTGWLDITEWSVGGGKNTNI